MRRRAANRIVEGESKAVGPVGCMSAGLLVRCLAIALLGLFCIVLVLPGVASAEAEGDLPPTRILILDDSNAQLAALLSVPGMAARPTPAEIADARIAEAVALGLRPELERKSGFRKRKRDLFRAERPVEIGEQEMVLRLRLRAKKRETMRVELRF